jgi:hypothetical protein
MPKSTSTKTKPKKEEHIPFPTQKEREEKSIEQCRKCLKKCARKNRRGICLVPRYKGEE